MVTICPRSVNLEGLVRAFYNKQKNFRKEKEDEINKEILPTFLREVHSKRMPSSKDYPKGSNRDKCLNETLKVYQSEECNFARVLISMKTHYNGQKAVISFLKEAFVDQSKLTVDEFWQVAAFHLRKTVDALQDIVPLDPSDRNYERLTG